MNKRLVSKIERTTSKLKPTFHRDGNFTACILLGPRGKIVSVGVAKRNPNQDPDIPERGQEIALARAVKKVKK